MRTNSRVRALWRAALAVVMATGCASGASVSSELNTDKLQDTLVISIHEQTGFVVRVDCPDDVPLLRGDAFACIVTAGDALEARVDVVQDDDQGNVSWSLNN